ncbi:inactive tyrosine-protein kinase 7 isoform X1 [Patella vulgata]|uniref:inactive tyrosine-protein kinase 7 isoform X1 n=1 Tax=Patella vulgata TaxID=6465 RepID=UPI0021808B36|nr:inactive tyrosine-protein kinase 7 isoform X1 [Patella vulgata]
MIVFLVLTLGFIFCQAQDNFYFSLSPRDLDVVEGTEIKLLCDVSDKRHIVFEWTQSGNRLPNTSRRFQEGSHLRILRVLRGEDEGPYQCIATNETTGFSLQSSESKLNIQWIEETAIVELRRPKREEIKVASDIILKCQITGNPEPAILWYNNKFRLFNTERVKILDEGSRLKVVNISTTDNGVYSCRAENVAGAVDSDDNFLLNVEAANTPHLVEDKFTPNQLVLKNNPARLDCAFKDAARIDWFSNYEKITNTTRHIVYSNGSLYFPKVRASDEGSYRCEGLSGNSNPAQTFTAQLTLSSLDDIMPGTFEPRLLANSRLVIPLHERFELKIFPPKGKPKPSFRWIDRNDLQIKDTGLIRTEGNKIIFENPQEIDSGNYTLVVNNSAGERKKSVWVIVSLPATIRRSPRYKEVQEGQSAEFSCLVEGSPYPVMSVYWKKDMNYISMNSARHSIDPMAGILRIRDVQMSDAGNYACVANTTGHPIAESNRAYLKVFKTLKFNPKPNSTYYLELHTQNKIDCAAEAQTPPTVHWIKHGNTQFKFPDHILDDQGVLYFSDVLLTDAGYYSCVATTKQGVINATIYVKIVESPKLAIHPENTTAYEGQQSFLHCVAIGDPKPTVHWDKSGRPIQPDSPRYKLFPNGTLLIKTVHMEDKGKYTCFANNSAGFVKSDIFIKVTSYTESEEEGFNMMKTIIIAVCSAGAYLALVIGLTVFCSYRLLQQRRTTKGLNESSRFPIKPENGEIHNEQHELLMTERDSANPPRQIKSPVLLSIPVKSENGDINREQHELLMKDRDSGTQFRSVSDSDNRSHISGMSSHPSHSSQSQQSRNRRGSFERFHFPRQDLQTLGMLGKGQFGDIFLAKARGINMVEQETLVVVKSLLNKEDHAFFEFRQEMDMYSKLDHPNIVKLLGVCREMEPQFLITEYCDWGDLKQFLLATRGDNGRRIPRLPSLALPQKLNMCSQVALGMEHLSNQRLIHKDLATRNILLTSRMELKICSLAMCHDLYAVEYFKMGQSPVPIRWLPPEAVHEEEFSTKTDVWSFGVLVWEVFHLAEIPYRQQSDEEVLKGLKSGILSLSYTEQCPNVIVDFIRKCMLDCPKDRPSFSDICVTMGDLLSAAFDHN